VLEITAHRGIITDRHGEPLAVSTPVESVWASPDAVRVTPDQERQLAKLVGLTVPELRKRLSYVMLRRTKEEVNSELPEFTRQIRWVPKKKEATKALEAFALKQLPFIDALKATLDSKIDYAIEAAESELRRDRVRDEYALLEKKVR
jgi:cell division protein FtsI/penicillin-binding protein 2